MAPLSEHAPVPVEQDQRRIPPSLEMIPFAARSRKFTAAVPVTPASAASRGASAPPFVEVKINQDTAGVSASHTNDATTSSTSTTIRTPTRKVRQPPSAPPTTPMTSSSRELECDLASSSTSSTPESSLVATNTTTPTTIATLSEVSTKLLPTTTKSSRDDDDDESLLNQNNKKQKLMVIVNNCGSETSNELVDLTPIVGHQDIVASPTSTSASTRTSSSIISTSSTTTAIIGAATSKNSDKIKIGRDANPSVGSMAVGSTTAMTPATIPSASPSPTTDVDKKQQAQNSGDAPPSATKEDVDTKITDVGSMTDNNNNNNNNNNNMDLPSPSPSPSKVTTDMILHSSNNKSNKNNDDCDNKSSESKANDATNLTVAGGSSSAPTGLKMKDTDATVAMTKTEGSRSDDLLHSDDRLFAFDPNSIDDVLDLSDNACGMMMVGPSPAKYIHETLRGGHDGGHSFGHHEQYAFHHHQPYEQEYYDPHGVVGSGNALMPHQHPHSNPYQYSHHHPHYHQMGIVSPATNSMAARHNMAPASFATPSATRYSYDPNPAGTSFRDESAYLDKTDGATGESVAKSFPWSPIKTPKPTKTTSFRDESAYLDKTDGATGESVAKSFPWSPIKTPKPTKTTQEPQKKLLTDIGTTVTVKVKGMDVAEVDDEPFHPNPPHSQHRYHHHHGAMESQVHHNHPSNHQTVVLHPSPPNSPTPSVSSTSILEAVLKVREEFSNDGGCDRLGTAPSICTINHDAGLRVYAPNPVVPVPHTIAFGGGRDSRSGVVTDISVSSWSASRRSTPSTSTFSVSGHVPTPNGTDGQFVDAHVPTFTNTTATELRTLQIPLSSKEDSDAFRSIMSPLTIAGVEERTGGFEPNNGGSAKDNGSATAATNECSRHVWSGIIEGRSDSPFKKIAKAVNNTSIVISPSEEVKAMIHPSTLPTVVTGSSITGRAGGSKKKGTRIRISIKKADDVGATKVIAGDAPFAKTLMGTAKNIVTDMRDLKHEECKVSNETTNEASNKDVKSTKFHAPEKKEPPKKAKSSVKKSNPRPASTRILRTRGVKTDAVVDSGTMGNNDVVEAAINVDANASVEDKAELLVPKSSKEDPKKQSATKKSSKAGTKKTGQLSNAEKRGQKCSVDGCPKFRQARSNGMCRSHYLESQGLKKYHRPAKIEPAADTHDDGDDDNDDDNDDSDENIDIEENWHKVEPCDLVPNTRVLIAYKEELFRGTVREIPDKEGGKYRVHYDGFKKGKTYLVPFSVFRALLDEDDHPVEMAETPHDDDGNGKVYSVQVSVFSDGKISFSSIEVEATGTDPTATEADADLAIDLEWRQCLESLVSHQKQYGCIPPEGTKAYKWFVKQTYEYSRKKSIRRSSLIANQIALLEQKAGFVFRSSSAIKRQYMYNEMANANDGDREAVNSESPESLPKETNKKMRKN